MITSRVFCLTLIPLCGLGGLRLASAEPFYYQGLYGWYEAGAAIAEDAKIQDFFGELVNGNRVEFDTGFHFGIGVGRELTPYVRIEMESGFNYNALKSIEDATASSGNIYRIPVMGNLVLLYPNRTRFVPVIGAGVGAQWAKCDAQKIDLGVTILNDDAETWVFSYQGYAGVRYQFNDRMNLGVFYHYNVADGPSWDFGDDPGGNFKLDSIRTHSFSLTLGWQF